MGMRKQMVTFDSQHFLLLGNVVFFYKVRGKLQSVLMLIFIRFPFCSLNSVQSVLDCN